MPDYEPGDDPSQAEWVLAGFEEKLERIFKAALKEVLQLIPQPEVKTQTFEDMSYTLDEIDDVFSRVYKQGESVVAKETEKAYKQGWLYGGIRLGEPPEVRKGIWGAIGARVIKTQSDFRKITDATAGQIRGIIAEGMTAERNYGVIAGEITEAVDGIGINRAKTMVRSETMRAVNDGVKDRYASNGVQLYRRLEASDERTCHDWPFEVGGKIYSGCAGIDGKIFTREQADSIDRQTHPNCRGTWTPHIEVPEEGEEAAPEEEVVEELAAEPLAWYPKTSGQNATRKVATEKALKEAGLGDARYMMDVDEAEMDALDHYTKEGFQDINAWLRKGRIPEDIDPEDIDQYVEDYVKPLDQLLSRHSVPKGVEIYRGTGPNTSEAIIRQGVGSVIDDLGYQSFSYDIEIAEYFVGMNRGPIDDPKYVILRYISDGKIGGAHIASAESEVLLSRGCSWKVIALEEKEVKGKTITYATVQLVDKAKGVKKKVKKVKKVKEIAFNPKKVKLDYEKGKKQAAKIREKIVSSGIIDSRECPTVAATLEESHALHQYSGITYRKINAELREGTLSSTTQLYVKYLDSLLSRTKPVPRGVELFRGLGRRPGRAALSHQVGDILEDAGYQSFSFNSAEAFGFAARTGPSGDRVLLRVVGDGDLKGAFIDSTECEFVLPRGTQWKILSIDKTQIDGSTLSYYTVKRAEPKKLLWNPNSITLDSTVAKKEANALVEKLGLVDVRKNSAVGLTPKQKKEINNYVGSGYGTINSYLRNGKTSAILSKILKELDATIAKGNSLKKGTELYRGVGYNTSMRLLKCKPGDILEDAAYQSFSINPQVAHSFSKEVGDDKARVVLRFVADGDTRGVFISEGDEYEYILARGTRMEILSIDEGNSNGLKTLFYTVKVVK